LEVGKFPPLIPGVLGKTTLGRIWTPGGIIPGFGTKGQKNLGERPLFPRHSFWAQRAKAFGKNFPFGQANWTDFSKILARGRTKFSPFISKIPIPQKPNLGVGRISLFLGKKGLLGALGPNLIFNKKTKKKTQRGDYFQTPGLLGKVSLTRGSAPKGLPLEPLGPRGL